MAVALTAAFVAGVTWRDRHPAADPYAIEPYRWATIERLAADSAAPPLHSTAMCADGWYTFAKMGDEPCRGHGGVRLRTDHLFTPSEMHEWMRVRDSSAEAALIGRTPLTATDLTPTTRGSGRPNP